MGTVVLAALAAFVLLMIFISLVTWYRKCPSDRIMVIFGKTHGTKAALCIHGGAKFVWPVFQDYGYISLRPLQIAVNLDNALCKQNIRINVPSVFTVGVSTSPEIMGNAAERLFGQTPEAIAELAKDIIFGQLRLVIASMMIEEINADRETFLRAVEANVAEELKKLGLELLNVNITDITDESGYIKAIGQRAAAGAINKAKIDVAEETRKGKHRCGRGAQTRTHCRFESGSGGGRGRSRRRAGAAHCGETGRSRRRRRRSRSRTRPAHRGETGRSGSGRGGSRSRTRSPYRGQAGGLRRDAGENISAIEIAQSNATRAEQEAEAYRRAEAARQIAAAQIEKAKYEAEADAQISRARLEEERQKAEVIVPAEISKEQIEIAADAEAEKTRREAKGVADAIYAKLEAEARGNYEILKAKGEGYKQIIAACDNDANAASKMLLIEKLQDIVALQAEAIKGIKIDKVTVWDGGSKSADGKTTTANFLSGMIQSLPPLHDVAGMAGLDLPDYLGKVKSDRQDSAAPEPPKA
ncbi:MAG: flotillin family protein [Lentisphaeria bacterium]|nr:MAG: flotillin family protein [Lentisphaeria bacterium]